MIELDCEDSGELNEHTGVKIERSINRMKLTQPVSMQPLDDEFELLNIYQHLLEWNYSVVVNH